MANLQSIRQSIKIVRGNIINETTVKKALTGCDVIVHQAFPYAKSGMSLEEQYVNDGVIGTFNILKQAVMNSVPKVVFASSVAVYGIPEYLPIDENHPVNPFLPYGATKRAGELYCSSFSKLYGLETVSLRYFYVYGPRYSTFDHSALVNFLDRARRGQPLIIYGDGSQIRDYTYIDDAIRGTISAIKHDHLYGQIFNLSSGQTISINQLAELVKKISGQGVKIISANLKQYRYVPHCLVPIGMTGKKQGHWTDERNYHADISAIRQALEFKPTVDLTTGITQTWHWLSSQR